MSMPNIPDVDADINITREQSVTLLLASIAFEELGLAHLINSEAEKIQYTLGTLENQPCVPMVTINDLLCINDSVSKMLKNIIKTQMLLQFKLEDALALACEEDSCYSTCC